MDWIIYTAAAVLSGLAGMAMFVTGRQVLEQKLEDFGQDTAETDKYKKSYRLCLIGMWISGLLLAWFLPWYYHAETMVVVRTVFLCALLWVCTWTDFTGYLIPNKVLIFGIVLWGGILALQAVLNWRALPYQVLNNLIGGVLMGAVFALCRAVSPGGVGWGDVKLVMVMGLYLGAGDAGNAIFWSLLCCFAVSVVLLITKKAKRDSAIPFAPFLLMGTEAAAFLTGI